jgi:hypothetical protein
LGRHPSVAVTGGRIATPAPVTPVHPRPGVIRTDACPHPSLLAHPSKQPAAGLLDHVELSIPCVHAQSIEGSILGLFDGTTSGLDPLHGILL